MVSWRFVPIPSSYLLFTNRINLFKHSFCVSICRTDKVLLSRIWVGSSFFCALNECKTYMIPTRLFNVRRIPRHRPGYLKVVTQHLLPQGVSFDIGNLTATQRHAKAIQNIVNEGLVVVIHVTGLLVVTKHVFLQPRDGKLHASLFLCQCHATALNCGCSTASR